MTGVPPSEPLPASSGLAALLTVAEAEGVICDARIAAIERVIQQIGEIHRMLRQRAVDMQRTGDPEQIAAAAAMLRRPQTDCATILGPYLDELRHLVRARLKTVEQITGAVEHRWRRRPR
jgi:hypothetical protein